MTAVKLDRGLAARLRERFAGEYALAEADPGAPGTLHLIEGDALDQPLTRLCPAPYNVVANLPYHVAADPPPTARRAAAPDRLVLMVQREVAERIAAPPGK